MKNIAPLFFLKVGQICFLLYLQKQNELREPLDGLHHQAVQSHPVTAGLLTMLGLKKIKGSVKEKSQQTIATFFF